jgi:hypothetical protein
MQIPPHNTYATVDWEYEVFNGCTVVLSGGAVATLSVSFYSRFPAIPQSLRRIPQHETANSQLPLRYSTTPLFIHFHSRYEVPTAHLETGIALSPTRLSNRCNRSVVEWKTFQTDYWESKANLLRQYHNRPQKISP